MALNVFLFSYFILQSQLNWKISKETIWANNRLRNYRQRESTILFIILMLNLRQSMTLSDDLLTFFRRRLLNKNYVCSNI